MTDRKADEKEAGAGGAPKAPYQEPAIAWEEPLETRPSLMAACGQKPAGGGDCETQAWS